MKEVITLQLGSYANYVGAHFWNFQDELQGLAADMDSDPVYQNSGLDMDVLYRHGQTRKGVATYVPRLVAVDLRGSLGAVSSSGSLYESPALPAKTTSWSGRVETYKAEPSRKSELLQRLEDEEEGLTSSTTDEAIVQQLDSGVESWTDYLKTYLHPRSVCEVEGVWSGVTPFDNFGCGKGLFSEAFRLEEFEDRFRFFAEECDHLQGVQAFVDDSGGFSGVASDLFSHFEDEYGDISLMLFTVRAPEQDSSRSVVGSLHDAISFSTLYSHADVIVPLGLPQLSNSDFARELIIDDSKHFHTSAVYASALHCATLPFRMESSASQFGASSMDVLLKNLTYATKKVAHLSAALPAASLISGDKNNLSRFSSLTPTVTTSFSCKLPSESFLFQGPRLADWKGQATRSDFTTWLSSTNITQSSGMSHVAFSPCPMAVPLPFPPIFGPSVGQYGDILPPSASTPTTGRGGLDVLSVPVATVLRTDTGIEPFLSKRLIDLEQYGLKTGAPGSAVLSAWGFEKEETDELREELLEAVSKVREENKQY